MQSEAKTTRRTLSFNQLQVLPAIGNWVNTKKLKPALKHRRAACKRHMKAAIRVPVGLSYKIW